MKQLTHEQRMELLDRVDDLRYFSNMLFGKVLKKKAQLESINKRLEGYKRRCDEIQDKCKDTIRILEEAGY